MLSGVINLRDVSVDHVVRSGVSSAFPQFTHTLLVSQGCSLYIQLSPENTELCHSGHSGCLGWFPCFCPFTGECVLPECLPCPVLRMGWGDRVHSPQPLMRCEFLLCVGPLTSKEPCPRAVPARPGQRCHPEDILITHVCAPGTSCSPQKLLAPPSLALSARPPGSRKSPALPFLMHLER